jgi:hypothetical protein
MPHTRASLSTMGMRCTLCFSIRHAASATLLSGRDATGGFDMICSLWGRNRHPLCLASDGDATQPAAS